MPLEVKKAIFKLGYEREGQWGGGSDERGLH